MNLKEKLADQVKGKIETLRLQRDWALKARGGNLLKLVELLVERHKLTMYQSVESYGSYIYLTANNLSGLKDERLSELLYSFIGAEPDKESTEDYPASYSRQYSFNWRNPERNGTMLTIVVTAEFGAESETCKRVITGYKEPSTEPTPIYELRCEGDVVDSTGVRIEA